MVVLKLKTCSWCRNTFTGEKVRKTGKCCYCEVEHYYRAIGIDFKGPAYYGKRKMISRKTQTDLQYRRRY